MNVISSAFDLATLLRAGWTPFDAVRGVWAVNTPTAKEQGTHDSSWCEAAFRGGLLLADRHFMYRPRA